MRRKHTHDEGKGTTMGKTTLTYGDKSYDVVRTDDAGEMINLTIFSKSYPDLRPQKFGQLKAWITKTIKVQGGLYRQGDSIQSHLVDESVWLVWMAESVGPTPSAGSKQGGFDEENRSWISGLFAEWKSTVHEWFTRHETLATQHGARITRTEDKVEKILSWQYEHGEMLKNRADVGRVSELERQAEKRYSGLVDEIKVLKARIATLEDKGDGGKGKKNGGWF